MAGEECSPPLDLATAAEAEAEEAACRSRQERKPTETGTKADPAGNDDRPGIVGKQIPRTPADGGGGEALDSSAAAIAQAFGSVSLRGRSREMEDAVSIRPGFFSSPSDDILHFFAVFDGHGGSQVAALCRERMHLLVAEELSRRRRDGEEWSEAVRRGFERMDGEALSSSCSSSSAAAAAMPFESQFVGSTATVAILAGDRVLVANCGDSRAVLGRAGRAFPLSSDHKPDRPDELARIEAAGGRVVYNDVARVQGILAMSRAIGDKYLKPVVTWEPEIVLMERSPEDEFLILATDGLWDVLSNDIACAVARTCLQEEEDHTSSSSSAAAASKGGRGEQQQPTSSSPESMDRWCSLAAAVLARLALGRNSADNISVIVIDLRR